MRARVKVFFFLLLVSGMGLYLSDEDNADILYGVVDTVFNASGDKHTVEDSNTTQENRRQTKFPTTTKEWLSESRLWMNKQNINASKWLDAEKNNYSEILNTSRFNALVIPFYAPQYAVDPTELSLMTRYFQWGLEQSSNYTFPNLLFLERALGKNKREYKRKDIIDFAKKYDSDLLVWGELVSNGSSDLVLSINIINDVSSYKENDKIKTVVIHITGYSDISPPSEIFSGRLNEIIQQVGEGAKGNLETTSYPAIGNIDLPENFRDLFTAGNITPVEAAYKLQLIGIMQPGSQVFVRRRLFERSLVLLSGVSEDSPDYRLLKARALFYLFRRPAASFYMSNPATPEELAFRAYIDGNSVDLRNQIIFIKPGLKKLIAEYEFHNLNLVYDGQEKEFYKSYKAKYPDYSFYLYSSYIENDGWKFIDNTKLKLNMENLFPLEGSKIESFVRGKLAINQVPNAVDIDILALNHVRDVLDKYKNTICCNSNNWYLGKSDHIELLDGYNIENILKRVRHSLNVQGRPDTAIELINSYEPVISGHPGIAILKARSILSKADHMPEKLKKDLKEQGALLALHALYWDKGNTRNSSSARRIMTDVRSNGVVTYENSPPSMIYVNEIYKNGYYSFPYEQSGRGFLASQLRELDYYHAGIGRLSILIDNIRNQGNHDKADELLKKFSHRFVGDPERTVLYADFKLREGDVQAAATLYLNAVDRSTSDWVPYQMLGRILVAEMRYEEAMNVYMKYPGFNDSSLKQNRVWLSNISYSAGSYLYWRGAYKQARKLYEISANYETGSGAGLSSAVRLALIDRNYIKAAQISRIRATRYNSGYAYRDYMSFLHLFGYSKDASALFENISDATSDPYIWTAAFIGHRKQATSDKDILDWINVGKKNLLMKNHVNLSARYMFMVLAIDRPANESLSRIMKQQVIKNKGTVSKNYLNEWEFINNRSINLAKVYNALKKNDYDKILSIFDSDVKNVSRKMRASKYALPYYVIAASKTGKIEKINHYLDEYYIFYKDDIDVAVYNSPFTTEAAFEYELAMSVLHGLSSKHDEAIKTLDKAFSARPHTEMRPIFTWYQLVEICELLYEMTKDDRYRLKALEWSKQYQVVQPQFAWAYAVEAKYTNNEKDKIRALGIALYLDKASDRISDIDKSTKEKAGKWMEKNNPFKIKHTKQDHHV